MPFLQKVIAASAALTIAGVAAISGFGGSEQAVNSVKRFMGLNPMSEQALTPLPGQALQQASSATASGADDAVSFDEQSGLSLRGDGSDQIAAIVKSMVAGDGTVILPNGRRLSPDAEAINLDDFNWE